MTEQLSDRQLQLNEDLLEAVVQGDAAAVSRLLDANADPNMNATRCSVLTDPIADSDSEDGTFEYFDGDMCPLHFALCDSIICELLLSHNADPNAAFSYHGGDDESSNEFDVELVTALHLIAARRPLHSSAYQNQCSLRDIHFTMNRFAVPELCRNGSCVNETSLAVLESLISHNADPMAKMSSRDSEQGYSDELATEVSPLHIAAHRCNLEVAIQLLKCGADPTAETGWSDLRNAVQDLRYTPVECAAVPEKYFGNHRPDKLSCDHPVNSAGLAISNFILWNEFWRCFKLCQQGRAEPVCVGGALDVVQRTVSLCETTPAFTTMIAQAIIHNGCDRS